MDTHVDVGNNNDSGTFQYDNINNNEVDPVDSGSEMNNGGYDLNSKVDMADYDKDVGLIETAVELPEDDTAKNLPKHKLIMLAISWYVSIIFFIHLYPSAALPSCISL